MWQKNKKSKGPHRKEKANEEKDSLHEDSHCALYSKYFTLFTFFHSTSFIILPPDSVSLSLSYALSCHLYSFSTYIPYPTLLPNLLLDPSFSIISQLKHVLIQIHFKIPHQATKPPHQIHINSSLPIHLSRLTTNLFMFCVCFRLLVISFDVVCDVIHHCFHRSVWSHPYLDYSLGMYATFQTHTCLFSTFSLNLLNL